MQKPLVKTCDYFPSIDWFRSYQQASECILPIHRAYQRKGMENRCTIGSAQGPLVLSVPLQGGRNQHATLQEIQIAYNTRWQHQHAQAIRSAYGRAPFFEHYYSLFEPVFTQAFPSLVELNLFIIERSLKALKITPHHQLVTTNNLVPETAEETIIQESSKPYLQPFIDRLGFMPNLSILDLLFCCGPTSSQYL